MKKWVGQTKQDLVLNLGPPSNVTSDGNNGEIYIYSRQIYMAPTAYTSAKTYWQHRLYYININNVIYHWGYQENEVPPQQINLNIRYN